MLQYKYDVLSDEVRKQELQLEVAMDRIREGEVRLSETSEALNSVLAVSDTQAAEILDLEGQLAAFSA